MNLDYLKALVASAKGSEELYMEQAAAMEFTLAFGERLIKLVEAGQAIRDNYVEDLQQQYGPNSMEHIYRICPDIVAWDAAIKEEDV